MLINVNLFALNYMYSRNTIKTHAIYEKIVHDAEGQVAQQGKVLPTLSRLFCFFLIRFVETNTATLG